MSTRTLYRLAAILIVLFDLGHTAGYPWSDPAWGVDLRSIQATHFDVFGFSRTYWHFYIGFGLFVSAFLLLAAVVAWELGNVRSEAARLLRGTAWALALCFVGVSILSWMYFFTIPLVFSILIAICLTLAAWRSASPPQ